MADTQQRPPSQPRTFSDDFRDLGRLLYTNNPFYAISAALVFWGLRISFDPTVETFQTGALMAGLAGYTLLLAGTAWLLVRLGQVWDDVRTLLLLVVLLLLAISISFDDRLAADPAQGRWWFLGGLGFAMVLSEALLHGLRLRLPWLLRLPYHALLAMFFLYPVFLSGRIGDPYDPALSWALFGFSPAVGVLLLALLPAAWRGPRYAAHPGAPWPWPYYPWVLFGVLLLGAMGRSYYLCHSFHFLGDGVIIFRPYFLAPMLLAASVVGLELAVQGKSRTAQRAALLATVPIVLLSMSSATWPPNDAGFLNRFLLTSGATPLFWTLAGAAVVYLYAMLRGAAYGAVALTAALAMLAVVPPTSFDLSSIGPPQAWPLWAMAGVHAALTLRRRHAAYCITAMTAAMAAGAAEWPVPVITGYHYALPVHLLLLAALVVGLLFHDVFAKVLQYLTAAAIAALACGSMFGWPAWFTAVPSPWIDGYPLALLALALVYGYVSGNKAHYAAAALIGAGWPAVAGWRFYRKLRLLLIGFDQIILGAVFFLIALLVSLWKAGLLQRLLARRPPEETEQPGT